MWALLALLILPALAEEVPIKSYTTAEGLGHNRVKRIVADSHGFLWLCTTQGLSRFDGAHFTNFGPEQGLASTNDLLEVSPGNYWVATNGNGIIRFTANGTLQPVSDESTKSRFKRYTPGTQPATSRVNVLYRDTDGAIWLGTDGGLFRLEEKNGTVAMQPVPLRLPGHSELQAQVISLLRDAEGSLWVGTRFGLLRILPGGRHIVYSILPRASTDSVYALLIDRNHQFWVGNQGGLLLFRPQPAAGYAGSNADLLDRGLEKIPRIPLGSAAQPLPDDSILYQVAPSDAPVYSLRELSGGRLGIGTIRHGFFEFRDGRITPFSTDIRLLEDTVSSIAEDSAANIWLATSFHGGIKLSLHGFITYGASDGLVSGVVGIIPDENQQAVLAALPWRVARFDGGKLISASLNITGFEAGNGFATPQALLIDHLGEYWVGTRAGVYRYPKVERLAQLSKLAPKAIYKKADGLAEDIASRLEEDSHGDIWISSFAPARTVITRWHRATGTFQVYSDADGLPAFNAPSDLFKDRSGNLWIGFREGGLAQFQNGKFRYFSTAEGFPAGEIKGCRFDASDRLWCANSQHGLMRLDKTGGSNLAPIFLSTRQGLSNNLVTAVSEERGNRLYAGTMLGVDQINPANGAVRHFTLADDQAGEVLDLFFDRQSVLWVAGLNGVGKLVPEPERSATPVPVLIGGLRIAGVAYQVSAVGASNINLPDLPAGKNSIQIDYLGLRFTSGAGSRFEYKLDGAADSNWSEPTTATTVTYPNIAPGSYRFIVRAADARDGASNPTATLNFRVLPPFWKQGWFIALAVALIAGGLLAFDRYRVARMNEVAAALTKSHQLTQQLTQQGAALRQANAALSLEYAVTRILAESAEPPQAACRILEEVCGTIGRVVGVFWYRDSASGLFRCLDLWNAPGHEAPELERLTRNAMVSPESTLSVAVLSPQPDSPRLAAAYDAGLRSVASFPILLGKETIGVLELFGKWEVEAKADEAQTFSILGGHIGQWLERKRAEDALRRSQRERLAELERVRRRIATDLHDDIGSSLTHISVLGEVARREIGDSNSLVAGQLSTIAGASRELIDSMSDIVWAINPHRDRLSDLVHRMRRFAADTFSARSIELRLRLPSAGADMKVEGNLRREVFLIFKEGINNMIRHSGCTEADVEFRAGADSLLLTLRDNGKGFDTLLDSDGHGLMSMKSRASDMGATLSVVSGFGGGTLISLIVPLPVSHINS